MKKLAPLFLIFLTTGCTVSKPVILNASYKQLDQVKKAYSQTTTRNGTNDIEFAKVLSGNYTLNQYRFEYYYSIYITPYNNPANFDYADDSRSTGTSGNYRSYDTSIFFATKVACRYSLRKPDGTYYPSYYNDNTMEINTNAKNLKVFKTYKLPYDTTNWGSDRTFYSYILRNTLETTSSANSIIINPFLYTYEEYINVIRQSQLYYWYNRTVNISDLLPTIPGEDNTNKLGQFYYYDVYTIGALNVNFWDDLDNLEGYSQFKTYAKNKSYEFFNLDNAETGYISYQYNASMSEELTAYENGYSQGIEEGTSGVGTTRVQQVFRAIQSFLNIDFGFFRLAHVLGGMLVIAIVIFVVRWFR